jgi:hypothetical protein
MLSAMVGGSFRLSNCSANTIDEATAVVSRPARRSPSYPVWQASQTVMSVDVIDSAGNRCEYTSAELQSHGTRRPIRYHAVGDILNKKPRDRANGPGA